MTLSEIAFDVLTTPDGRLKTAKSLQNAQRWQKCAENNQQIDIGTAMPPLQPPRPKSPELLSPRDVPKRKPATMEGGSRGKQTFQPCFKLP